MSETRNEDLSLILERCRGPLLAVHRVSARDPVTGDDILSCEDLEALVFKFLGADLWVPCDGATDELRLSLEGPSWPGSVVKDLSAEMWWKAMLGLELAFIWLLQNERGYQDAVQLECFDRRHIRLRRRVQLEAAASRIRVFIVDPL